MESRERLNAWRCPGRSWFCEAPALKPPPPKPTEAYELAVHVMHSSATLIKGRQRTLYKVIDSTAQILPAVVGAQGECLTGCVAHPQKHGCRRHWDHEPW